MTTTINYYLLLGMVVASCATPPPKATDPLPQPQASVAPTFKTFEQTPWTAGDYKKLILIGDSHSDYAGEGPVFGFFSKRMQELLPGLSVLAASGSDPDWFVSGFKDVHLGCTSSLYPAQATVCKSLPKLSSVIEKYNGVIIEQGANMTGWSEANIKRAMASLFSVIGARRCWIVGKPPANVTSTKEELRIETILKSLAGDCTYLSSRFFKFEDGPLHDQEHLNKHAANLWAEGIARQIK